MAIDTSRARSIFAAAVEDHSPEQWNDFLDNACGGDVALRQRVEALLRAHEGEDSLLDRGDDPPAATADRPIAERLGTVIGPYKLLQQIGEGGMGVVFLAEQERPVKRRVALKVIKPGMDTREVIARFEAERQALALMDHPHIAKDAGTTENGRPYFVMELVQGVPMRRFVCWILTGVIMMHGGCSQRPGEARLPIAGKVSLASGERLSGSVTFVPTEGHSGPAATTSVVDGHYEFDRTNGPTAGPHRVIVVRSVSKDSVLAARMDKKSKDSKGAATAESKLQWTLLIDLPAVGSNQCNLSLEP